MYKKRRIIAILLTIFMIFTTVSPVFADTVSNSAIGMTDEKAIGAEPGEMPEESEAGDHPVGDSVSEDAEDTEEVSGETVSADEIQEKNGELTSEENGGIGDLPEDFEFVPGYIEMPWDRNTPVADDRITFEEAKRRIVDDKNDGEESAAGYIPDVAVPSAYPYSYTDEDSLRQYFNNSLMPLRNQGSYGTCWAHSAVSLLEGYMLSHGFSDKNGTVGKNVDYSELQLAYFYYHNNINPITGTDGGDVLNVTPSDNEKINKSHSFLGIGGNLGYAAQSLINWRGAVSETDKPYSDAASIITSDNGKKAKSGISNELAQDHDVVHLSNEFQINIKSNPSIVKQAILSNKIVGVSFYAEDPRPYYDPLHNSYWCNQKKADHAVAIIGWDDSFPKENFNYSNYIDSDGAWLVRNSWKTEGDDEYSLSGYFWLSYCDNSLSDTAYVFEAANDDYDNNYYHTNQIHRQGCISCEKYANVFTVNGVKNSSREKLEAVAVEVCNANSPYTISIYAVDSNGKPSGEKLTNDITGTFPYAGIYTIPIEDNVVLNRGEKFAIAVETLPNTVVMECAFDDPQWSSVVTVKKGESFFGYSNSSEWYDFYSSASGGQYGNFCINAFTKDITSNSYSPSQFAFSASDAVYNGSEHGASVTPKNGIGGKTATIYYRRSGSSDPWVTVMPVNAGTYCVAIDYPAYGAYGEVKKLTDSSWKFTTTQRNISYATTAPIDNKIYTGTAVTPKISITDFGSTLEEDTDYTVSYSDNIYIGTATVTISGKGNYNGSRTRTFKIVSGITVSFDYNGGTGSPENMNVVNGSSYGTLPTPARAGYAFGGWYTEQTGGSQITASSTVTKTTNHTLYAHWTPNNYTVTFNANGGSVSTTSKIVTYDSTYGSLPVPTSAGYTFDGWYTAQSAGTKITDNTRVTTTNDHTLYAHWIEKKIIVGITQYGYGIPYDEWIEVTYGKAYGTFPDPGTMTGFSFEGWYDAKTGGTRITENTIVTKTEDHWIYEHWTPNDYTVYFNTNGGSVSTTSKIVTYDSTYGTLPTPTRTGYNFEGWYDAISGGNQITADSWVKKAADHTLYGHWTTKNCYVTYNANGGSVSETGKTVSYKDIYGPLPVPTRTGYKFNGWFTSQTGGTEITERTTVTKASDHTIYAHWTIDTYTVTYDANGGKFITMSGGMEVSALHEEKTVVFDEYYGEMPIPTRTGYEFDGYYTSKTGGNRVTENTKVTATGDHILYAHWTAITCELTYDANGGSVSENGKNVTYGTNYGLLPTPTRFGYDFEGWYTLPNGGNKITENTKITESKSHTIYAHWIAKTFTVTFNANGGTVDTSSKTVTYGEAYGTLPNPVKSYDYFTGWFTDIDGGERVTEEMTVSLTENLTLYAHWAENVCTVSFNSAGGSNVNAIRVAFGDAVGSLPVPVKTGYVFWGWYTESVNGSRITESSVVWSNCIYYAHWNVKSCKVTFNSNGGNNTPAGITVKCGSKYGNLSSSTRAGYNFDGWFTEADGGTEISADTIVTKTEDHTLYAHWTAKKYKVSFDSKGGSTVDSIIVTYGQPYGTLPCPTKEGSSFKGWYNSDQKPVTDTTVVTKTSDHTLAAKWDDPVKKDISKLTAGLSNTGNTVEGVIESIKWTGSPVNKDYFELYDNGSAVPKTEYTLSYGSACVDIGRNWLIATASGVNYKSEKTVYFDIVQRDLNTDVENVSGEAESLSDALNQLALKDKTLGNMLVKDVDYCVNDYTMTESVVTFLVKGWGHYSGNCSYDVKLKTIQKPEPVNPTPTPEPTPVDPNPGPGGNDPVETHNTVIGTAKVNIKDNFPSDTVKFKSSNTKLVTVTAKGVLTGKKAGDVTITGYRKVKSGKKYIYEETGTYEAHVVIPKMKKLTATSMSERKDAFKEMLYNNEDIMPDSWTSSNTKVATIASDGTVTVLKTGSATITACYGKYKTKAVLTVKLPKVNRARATINAGKTVKLKMSSGSPSWRSSDESVAKVDSSGTVTGTGSGTAVITATIGQDEYTSTITVKKPTLNKTKATIKTGKTVKLKLSAGSATWSSSDTSVASVDSSGTVTGKKPGTATIKAVYGHDEVTCTVTVK